MKKSEIGSSSSGSAGGTTKKTTSSTSGLPPPPLTRSASSTASKPSLTKSDSTTALPKPASTTSGSNSISGMKKSSTMTGTTSGSTSKSSTPPSLSKGLSSPNLPTTTTSTIKKTGSSTLLSSTRSSSSSASSSTLTTKPKSTSTRSSPSLTSSAPVSKVSSSTTKRPTTTVVGTSKSTTSIPSSKSSSALPPTGKSSSSSRSVPPPVTRSASKLSANGRSTSTSSMSKSNGTGVSTTTRTKKETVSVPNVPFDQFDPSTSEEFENVANEFLDENEEVDIEIEQDEIIEEEEEEIIEEEIFDNDFIVGEDDEEEEIIEEEIFDNDDQENMMVYSSSVPDSSNITDIDANEDQIINESNENLDSNLTQTQTIYKDINAPQVPDTEPIEIPSKIPEIKKSASSSWVSSIFSKITKSTTNMISSSISSSSPTNLSSTPIETSSVNSNSSSLAGSSSNSINSSPPLQSNEESNLSPPPYEPIQNQINNSSGGNQLKTLPPPNLMYPYPQNQGSGNNLNNQYMQPMQPMQSMQPMQPMQPIHHRPHSHHPSHPHNHHQGQRYNQYQMIQPHNQPGGLALVPFTLNSYRAITLFQDWYKSLWFAPNDFKEKIEPTIKLYKYFVPCHLFSTIVHSVHSGKVGFLKSDDPSRQAVIVSPDEQKKKQIESDEIDWSNGSTHPYTQSHNDVLIYSPQMNGIDSDPPIYLHIKEVNDWRIEMTEPFHSQHPQLLYPNYVIDQSQSNLLQYNGNQQQNMYPQGATAPLMNEMQSSQLNQLPSVPGKVDWERSWLFAEAKIKKNEIYGNDSKLKRDYHAYIVKDVETETKFENISYRTVYTPLYKINYSYDGVDYTFIINGQTGKHYTPQRPFGVGSIKTKAIRLLTGGVFSSEKTKSLEMERKISENGMVRGQDLNSIDKIFNEEDEQVILYHNDHYYLLLPSSDQFLLLKTTGYIILRNNSNEQIQIQSHKRMTDQIGGVCTLLPNEIQTFAYKGSWCIEVVQGDANSLELVKVETNSGGDKSFGDLLMQ